MNSIENLKEHIWDKELIPISSPNIMGEKGVFSRLYCLRKGCGGYRDYKKSEKGGEIRLSHFIFETSKYCNEISLTQH